jgi:hypothetical protein
MPHADSAEAADALRSGWKDALLDPPRAMRVIPTEDWSVELFRDSAASLGRLLRLTANTSTRQAAAQRDGCAGLTARSAN